jgi:hypothetical protein
VNQTTLNAGSASPNSLGPSSASVTLNGSFEIVSREKLKVHASITNSGKTDIYVFDQLWDQDRSGKAFPDPEGIYRFERNSELRLLLGPAPLPRLKTVTFKNVPFATPVKAGTSLELNREVALPVKEYSAYFLDYSPNQSKTVQVKRLVLIVKFVEAQQRLATSPCPFNPAAVKLETPGVLDSVQTLTWRTEQVDLEVLRRTDAFDRLTLPGEAPEPLVLSP